MNSKPILIMIRMTEEVGFILWLPNGTLASASDDWKIKIWQKYQIQKIETLTGHSRSMSDGP